MNEGSEEKPVFQCEEFYLPPSPSFTAKKAAKEDGNGLGPNNQSEGLCCNCTNRASCAMRLVEGGVWHCEEYC